MRENDDWIYAEFAEMPQYRTIDIDPATLNAPATPYLTDDEDKGEEHPRADGFAKPPEAPAAPVFVPAQ
jgi:hypothetical protein